MIINIKKIENVLLLRIKWEIAVKSADLRVYKLKRIMI